MWSLQGKVFAMNHPSPNKNLGWGVKTLLARAIWASDPSRICYFTSLLHVLSMRYDCVSRNAQNHSITVFDTSIYCFSFLEFGHSNFAWQKPVHQRPFRCMTTSVNKVCITLCSSFTKQVHLHSTVISFYYYTLNGVSSSLYSNVNCVAPLIELKLSISSCDYTFFLSIGVSSWQLSTNLLQFPKSNSVNSRPYSTSKGKPKNILWFELPMLVEIKCHWFSDLFIFKICR